MMSLRIISNQRFYCNTSILTHLYFNAMKEKNTPIEEDEELVYDSEDMMQMMFDEDCDPDEDMSGESIFGD